MASDIATADPKMTDSNIKTVDSNLMPSGSEDKVKSKDSSCRRSFQIETQSGDKCFMNFIDTGPNKEQLVISGPCMAALGLPDICLTNAMLKDADVGYFFYQKDADTSLSVTLSPQGSGSLVKTIHSRNLFHCSITTTFSIFKTKKDD